MKPADLRSSVVGVFSAAVSSLCCLLPLTVVVLGLGSGAFMAVTMRYSSIFIPVGILGTGLGYYLYFRERRRCTRLGCPMGGRRVNLALLAVSTVILAAAVTLTALPDYTARLIASWGGTVAMGDGINAADRNSARAHPTPASPVEGGAAAAIEHATLRVDGMT